MFPLLFQSSDGSWSVASYSVLLILGWLGAAWYVRHLASQEANSNHSQRFAVFFVPAFCSWICGRLVWSAFHPESVTTWWSFLIWDAGQSSAWAGLCVFVIASILSCIKFRISIANQLDVLAPAWLIMVVFERFGAFLSGGDFGLITEMPWGVQFPADSPAGRFHRSELIGVAIPEQFSLAVHPVQLYGGIAIALVVFIAHRLRSSSPHPGKIAKICLLGYASSRLLLEDPFKLTRSSDVIGSVSTDQFVSITVMLSMFVLLRPRRDTRSRANPSRKSKARPKKK